VILNEVVITFVLAVSRLRAAHSTAFFPITPMAFGSTKPYSCEMTGWGQGRCQLLLASHL